jgi:hypothetical protein
MVKFEQILTGFLFCQNLKMFALPPSIQSQHFEFSIDLRFLLALRSSEATFLSVGQGFRFKNY